MLLLDSINQSVSTAYKEKVRICQVGTGQLQGTLHYNDSKAVQGGVLLVPPHPGFAGTMDNNVLMELANQLTKENYIVLRFNYPGIGDSQFKCRADESVFDYWERVEREGDFELALKSVQTSVLFLMQVFGINEQRLHLIGYSYGAYVAFLSEALHRMAASVTAISMPWLNRYDYSLFTSVKTPKLCISGERDFVWDAAIWNAVLSQLPEPKESVLVDDDHFFRGTEEDLAERVVGFIKQNSQQE